MTARLPRGVVDRGGVLGYEHRGISTAFANPLYHIRQYGLQNPMVMEAIRLGVYDALCRECRGQRMVEAHRGFMCVNCPGAGDDGRTVLDESARCRRLCPECEGTGLRPELPVCEQDFLKGDVASREVAALIGVEIDHRRQVR